MPDQPTLRTVIESKKEKIAEKIGVFPGAASFMPPEPETLLKDRKKL
jgi:hypothetical protein